MATSSTTTTAADATVSSPPAWILFDVEAYIGNRPNDTTARDFTSNSKSIEVSLWPADPPAPSRLFVYCPNLGHDVFLEHPRILFTADGLLLLRVAIGCPPSHITQLECDYFIYRPGGPKGPSLQLLPNPDPRFFKDYEVGLLPRGDHFTIAAMPVVSSRDEYDLHLFNSEDWGWISKKVSVESPQRPFPMPIPNKACRLFHHITSTVITLGGEGGTMGWVDLWRGILLCDVLRSNPTLRGVPLPLPGILTNQGKGIEDCPESIRGIAVIEGCLKVVDLEVRGKRLDDEQTGLPNIRIDNWALTTYTNSKITNAWEDWKLDCTVEASGIIIDETMRSQLLRSGLLHKPQDSEAAERNLQNLHTTQPALSLDDKGVVYLLTRVKFLHPKVWVLAVDTKNNKLQAMAESHTKRRFDLGFAYCPSRITSYMNTTTPGTGGHLRCSGNQLQQADDGESTAASRRARRPSRRSKLARRPRREGTA